MWQQQNAKVYSIQQNSKYLIAAENHTRRSNNIIKKQNTYITMTFINVKYLYTCPNHPSQMLYKIKTILSQ